MFFKLLCFVLMVVMVSADINSEHNPSCRSFSPIRFWTCQCQDAQTHQSIELYLYPEELKTLDSRGLINCQCTNTYSRPLNFTLLTVDELTCDLENYYREQKGLSHNLLMTYLMMASLGYETPLKSMTVRLSLNYVGNYAYNVDNCHPYTMALCKDHRQNCLPAHHSSSWDITDQQIMALSTQLDAKCL